MLLRELQGRVEQDGNQHDAGNGEQQHKELGDEQGGPTEYGVRFELAHLHKGSADQSLNTESAGRLCSRAAGYRQHRYGLRRFELDFD